MSSLAASVSLLAVFADATRVRLLSLLEDEELSVAELVAITGLSQSRVSTHLGRLREAGIVRTRTSGATAFQAINQSMPAEAQKVWQAVRATVSDAALEADRKQRQTVVRGRAGAGTWLESVAGEMERHYSPGRTWESLAHGTLALSTFGDVLDVGSGDGFVSGLISARAKSVTCLDRSERMIAAAQERLGGRANVRYAVGDMHALPFPARSFDQVALFNVLTYSDEPERVVLEAARVLRKGGTLAVLTLNHHEEQAMTAPYGHVQPGFRPPALSRLLGRAGLSVRHCAIVARERRAPHFEVVAASAEKTA